MITEDILNKLPKLKYIGVCATGYNVIDTEACRKRNVVVTNVPAYSTDAVAQHVFAMITNFSNHVALHSVSEIGKAFGMKVICCTRTEKPGMPEMVSREEL